MTGSTTINGRFQKPGTTFALWYGILIGPITAMADQQVTYALVPHACSTGHHYVLFIATGIALAFVLSGAVVSARYLAFARDASINGGTAADRSRFMAILGLAVSLGFMLVILAFAVPRVLLSPCD